MRKLSFIVGAVMLVLVGGTLLPHATAAREQRASFPAPAFTHTQAQDWINSAPLTWKDLRGQVVLLDFWTYACWNCYRSFPWLHSVEKRYGARGLRVIGVHTPEFDHERVRDNVVAKVAQFKLAHPVMLDNDHSYWKAMSNQYWPAFYLVDRKGQVRGLFIGETHAGDRNAIAIEAAIEQLLAEPP